MGTFICCFCGGDTDNVDYVELEVFAPDYVGLAYEDGIRQQTLGAHASCLRGAVYEPEGVVYVDVPGKTDDPDATDVRDRYRRDSAALIELGVELARQRDSFPDIHVRIPRALAEAAVASWDWDQPENYDSHQPLSPQVQQESNRSATLALIGLTIENEGVWHDGHVEVELDPWHLGLALEASDLAESVDSDSGEGVQR